jgi:hypothetical protein
MEVTVVSNDYVGLVEVCRRMRGKDVNARRVAGGNTAIVLSEFIDVDVINGTQVLSCYAVGKGGDGRGV